ncbi:tyrosine-type recombinase/integrase [Clostridium botulinum]|uniref:tyrosine-type recombinase/integrase n=1 Tax=Clostridium botulinum TaxID=1491 RepID=UPI00174CBB8C|nr:site-specific integrase [Clostridium botulinum]MBD5589226.1 tyrosine-type recombinase/integrase [Clostridium botulinum]
MSKQSKIPPVTDKEWLEVRGDDNCPYVFVTKYGGEIKQISRNTFNQWCSNDFEKVIKRRVHPHILRESRATNLVIHEGKNIEAAQSLLGHESSETTQIYVIRDTSEDADEAFL